MEVDGASGPVQKTMPATTDMKLDKLIAALTSQGGGPLERG